MELKPLGTRVVIEPKQKETQVGGIIIPDSSNQATTQGIVRAVGHGVSELSVGDEVMFQFGAGQEIELNGTKHLIMNEDNVICVIK